MATGSIGANVAGGIYGIAGGYGLTEASRNLDIAQENLENIEVQFSDQSLKYDAGEAERKAYLIEKAGDTAASDFDLWANNFYSGIDDFMEAGKGMLLLGGSDIAETVFQADNAIINWGDPGWG